MSISPVNCPDTDCYWSAHGIPDKYTEARAWHLAAHRAEEHGEPLTTEQIAYATRAGHVIPGTARTTAAAAAAAGALPVPVGDQPQPLDDTRLAEIEARVEAATPGPWGIYESGSLIDVAADLQETGHGYRARRGIARLEDEPLDNDPTHKEWTAEQDWAQVQADAEFIAHAPADTAALLAEVQRLKAELAKYVGAEPTIAEEMAYLSRCLDAVRDLCDATEEQATRWENPLPVPEWVEQVRAATDGVRPDDPNDNRHRIFVDGKGNGWISVCSDEGTEWVVPIQPAAHVEQDVRDVADETGSLREIGRCW